MHFHFVFIIIFRSAMNNDERVFIEIFVPALSQKGNDKQVFGSYFGFLFTVAKAKLGYLRHHIGSSLPNATFSSKKNKIPPYWIEAEPYPSFLPQIVLQRAKWLKWAINIQPVRFFMMWVISLFQKCSKIYINLLHIKRTRNKSLRVQAKILFFRSCIFHLPSLSTHSEWFGSYYQHRQVFPINRYGKFSKSNLNRHRWLFVAFVE